MSEARSKPDSYVPAPEEIRAAFADATADDVTFVARLCLEVGAWDHAIALCDALGPFDSPGVRLCRAVATFVSGDGAAALESVDRLLAERPSHLSARNVRAQMLARSGDRAGAIRELVELSARYPDYPGAHGLLSTLVMPGPHYREVLSRIHDRVRPRTYLEIGIDTGATLALARHSQTIVGVDPARHPLVAGVSKNALLFHEESDRFFERSRDSVIGARRVDLGFIDGMHRFENALADFANLESWSHANGTIVLHDCVPIVPRTATRERGTKFWVGDTWKVLIALTRHRPELRIRTVMAPPSGLVIVRRLNPGSRLLSERFDEIVDSLRGVEWTHQPGDFPPELGAVPNDERGLSEALA